MKRNTKLLFWLPGLIPALVSGPYLPAAQFGQSKTETRGGEARVALVSVQLLPPEVSQGDVMSISIFFKIASPLERPEKVFLHLVKPGQAGPVINGDFFPRLPATKWEVGQVVEAGPVELYIPFNVPPGDYEIEAGLMEIVLEETIVRYVREPYTNQDIKNFVVGKLTVKKGEVKEEKKKPTELELINFENENDIRLWEPRGAMISSSPESDKTAAVVTINPDRGYPGVALENYFKLKPENADWSFYDALTLQITYPSESPSERLFLQIGDRFGRVFKEELRSQPGKTTDVDISMVELGGVINIAEIDEVKVFSYYPTKRFTFYISGLRLTSRGMPTGSPAVTLVKLDAPASIKRGEVFNVTPYFKLSQPIYQPHKMFVHIYRVNDRAGYVTGDVALYPPVREWALNQEIGVKSSPLMISPDSPPGTYIVQTGLYLIADTAGEGYVKMAEWDVKGAPVLQEFQPGGPIDYIKQPYANLEIEDWEVGTIKVE